MKTFYLAFLLLISIGVYSQNWEKSVNANYNWTYFAQSIEGDFNVRRNHHVLSAGMQVYLNQYADFEDGSYKNVGYAENWFDRFGLNVSYQYNIWKDSRTVNPYLFYQNMVSHLCFREPVYDSINYYGGDVGTISNPHWLMEQFIGIGFIFQIYKKVSVFQEAGIGVACWNNNPNYMQKILWEWDHTMKLGILYRIN